MDTTQLLKIPAHLSKAILSNEWQDGFSSSKLARGKTLARKLCVTINSIEIEPNQYTVIYFEVRGTRKYEAEVFANEAMYNGFCDCPDPDGKCKHLAAVYYFLHDTLTELSSTPPQKTISNIDHCHPQLLKIKEAQKIKTSAKLEYLTGILETLIEENRSILIFSQFTSMLSIIEKHLKKQKISFSKITGTTKDRKTPVDEFQSGKNNVFLISLKAGGTGLNLTAADTVIHFDPWWNPAAENQATDRAYRIGQKKPVFVHKLICQGSIEEQIQILQQQKAELVESLLSKSTNKTNLVNQESLKSLLAPIE